MGRPATGAKITVPAHKEVSAGIVGQIIREFPDAPEGVEVAMSTDYEVTAYRDGKWWTFEIPALTSPSPRRKGHRIVAMGQAHTAAEVATEARDVAALWTEDDDVSVHVVYRLPDSVRTAIERASERDAEGRAALDEAAALRRSAVRALRADGLTQSDTAAVLGVSRQRIQQLAH